VVDVETLAGNRLLTTIPESERERLAGELELVSLGLKASLYRENEPIEYVYFPISGVLSLVSKMDDGRGIEVATIGDEGMVGLPVFLQATRTSAHTAFAQIPGQSLQMALRNVQRVHRQPAERAAAHRPQPLHPGADVDDRTGGCLQRAALRAAARLPVATDNA